MNKEIKTILETLNNQIDSNELAAALKADNFEGEYALSEDGVKSILSQTKGLLSIDSAVNNPTVVENISKDLYPKHLKTFMTKFEDKLKPVLDKLGVDYSKYEYISDAIPDIEPKLSAMSTGENKELINSLNEDIRLAKEALTSQSEEFQNQLKQRDADILADKLQQVYKSKATEKQWAEAYSMPDVKNAIMNQVWSKINAKATLKLTDSGDVAVMQKDFPDKELYDGNKILTFQGLLEPEIEAYLKKSDPSGGHAEPKKAADNLTEAEKKRIAEYNRQKNR